MNADFSSIARYYDAMYVDPEAYREEAAQIIELCERYGRPQSRTLLDIACGTGEQSLHLSRRFSVTGLDLSPEMLQAARAKLPEASFLEGDMFRFQLDRRFDIVLNLYGSIGFASDTGELSAGIRRAWEHLEPGGLFLLTPWDTQETFQEKILTGSGLRGGIHFCRMEAVRRVSPRKVQVDMRHLVGQDGEITALRHQQSITLFSETEYRSALAEAGFRLRARLNEDQFRMGAFVCTKD